MTLTMPDIDVGRMKNLAHSAAYLLIMVVCALIAIEALALKTFNTALLKGLTALLQLF